MYIRKNYFIFLINVRSYQHLELIIIFLFFQIGLLRYMLSKKLNNLTKKHYFMGLLVFLKQQQLFFIVISLI